MTGETTDKQRRREQREQATHDADRHERRARLRLVFVPAAVIVLAMGGLAYAALSGDGPAAPAPAPTAAQISSPFGQHYAGLVARRARARVPTMMQTMSSPWHFHPLLALFVNGKAIKVPANIGIDPKVDGMQMAGLHTHDDSARSTSRACGAPRSASS